MDDPPRIIMRGLSGYGVARLYMQTRNPAFQCITHGCGRRIVEDLAADFRDSGRERTARLRAVTDHHHFIHQCRAFCQRHVDLRPGSYLFPAFVVTDIRKTSVSPDFALIRKFPEASVVVPTIVPSISTVTLTSGSPFGPFTCPVTVDSCGDPAAEG